MAKTQDKQQTANMGLKRVLKPTDDKTEHRPHKRQSRSPSSGHPSSPDVYETSSQPALAKVPMGITYSYFDDESSPSPSPSPSPAPDASAGWLLNGDNSGNYTHQPEDSAHQEDTSLHDNLDPRLSLDGQFHDDELEINRPDDSSAPNTLPSNSADHDDLDTQAPPLTAEILADPNTRLTDLSAVQRQEYYAALWKGKEIELKDLNFPQLYSEYPQFADEILHAYSAYNLVTAKVWSNYDSATHEFFWQPRNRFDDCGKLYLTPTQRRRLNSIDLEKLQMMNVRFDVGTPFRTLFQIFVWSREGYGSGLDARGYKTEDSNEPHEDLMEVVKEAMVSIKDDGLREDQMGLRLRDLDEIAKDFVLRENSAMYHTLHSYSSKYWT